VADPEALLGQPALRAVIEEARTRADVVLVRSAPIDSASRFLPLARLCDGILLVSRPRSLRPARAAQLSALIALSAPLVGVVLDECGPSRGDTIAAMPLRPAVDHHRGGQNGNGNAKPGGTQNASPFGTGDV
jgi:Mrp family chromosome partitioning ATPase